MAAVSVAADPYDEQAVRDLMRALVADGRAAAALSAYDDLAARLREDLGTTPTARPATCTSPCCGRPRCRPRRPAARPRRASGPGRSRGRAGAGRAGLGRARPRPAGPACCSSRARPASARPGCSTPSPTWPRHRRPRAARRAATRPSGRCSCSPTSTPCARSCSTPRRARWPRCCATTRPRGSRSLPELAAVVTPSTPLPRRRRLQRRRAYDAVAAVLRRLALRPAGAADRRRPAGRRCRDRRPARLPGRPARRRPRPGRRCRPRRGRDVGRPAGRPGRPSPARRAAPVGGRGPGRRRGSVRARRAGDGPHGRALPERRGVPARAGRRGRRRAGVARRGRPGPRGTGSTPRAATVVQAAAVLRRRHRPAPAGRAGRASDGWPRCGSARSWSGSRLLVRSGAPLRVRQRPDPGVRARRRCHRRWPRRTTAARPT